MPYRFHYFLEKQLTMNKINAAIKILLTSNKERKQSMMTVINFFFDEGVKATMASYQNHLGFNKEQIEEKKQELLKQI